QQLTSCQNLLLLSVAILNMNNLVKEYRKQADLTQEQLAGLVGVSRQTIISIERNKFDPSLSLAFELAAALKAPIDTLFIPDATP
ncbi:MAG TPA: helix-turn-helix transcriptional regulator, partial [Candidatus Saccharimonadales bacterium]